MEPIRCSPGNPLTLPLNNPHIGITNRGKTDSALKSSRFLTFPSIQTGIHSQGNTQLLGPPLQIQSEEFDSVLITVPVPAVLLHPSVHGSCARAVRVTVVNVYRIHFVSYCTAAQVSIRPPRGGCVCVCTSAVRPYPRIQ